MQRRNRNAKAPLRTAEAADPPTSSLPSPEEHEKAVGLFGDESDHFQSDLELPIKIETRNFNRRRRQSDSYSEPPVELQKEDDKAFPCQHLESEQMMSAHRNYDPIEELLLPLSQLEPSAGGKYQMELAGAEQLPEMPLEEEQLANELEKLPGQGDIGERTIHRKGLLKVINNFQAFNHSLAIAMNFHTLLRKDSVTKMYGSILGVLSKESNKMETALLEELRQAASRIKAHTQEEMRKEEKKDLFKTMAEDDKVIVKEEYIE